MTASLRHTVHNFLQSLLLVAGMAAIAWACVSLLWGNDAALWTVIIFAVMMLLTPQVSKTVILKAFHARRLTARDFPAGIALVEALAARAGLPQAPKFYYVPSSQPNAFAVGSRTDGAIAISDGLLRLLDRRELAGVLAHEISHIANRDLWIMGLADIMARLTTLTSYVGQFLLLFNLPLLLTGRAHVSWFAIALLILSPSLMSLLQLALSRTREYDADLGAVELTGDPGGLASALAKLERATGTFWEDILLPGRRIPDPSLLRTHPPTRERIKRLLELSPEFQPLPETGPAGAPALFQARHFPVIHQRPRMRITGIWL